MFGVHDVVVGIVLNADVTTLTDIFNTVTHQMMHADIELFKLPIGAQSHCRHFKQGMSSAVDIVKQHSPVFQEMLEKN